MRIKEILWQHRRDFSAIYECEHCGYSEIGAGYDDDYFHREVVPDRECPKCGKKADKENYRPMGTKYPEGYQI